MSIPLTATIGNLASSLIYPGAFPGGFLDQFLRKLSFEKVNNPSEAMFWNRSTSALTLAPTYLRSTLGLPATALDTSQSAAPFIRIGDIVELDYFDETANSSVNDQL